MRPKTPQRVRAQRKFAQGAATIPTTIRPNRRAEQSEPAQEPSCNITTLSASQLLSHVAFRNIHSHCGLRELRVVVDRLPTEESGRPTITPTVAQEPTDTEGEPPQKRSRLSSKPRATRAQIVRQLKGSINQKRMNTRNSTTVEHMDTNGSDSAEPSTPAEHQEPVPSTSTEGQEPVPSISTEGQVPVPATTSRKRRRQVPSTSVHKEDQGSVQAAPATSTGHKRLMPSTSTAHQEPVPSKPTELQEPVEDDQGPSHPSVPSTPRLDQEQPRAVPRDNDVYEFSDDVPLRVRFRDVDNNDSEHDENTCGAMADNVSNGDSPEISARSSTSEPPITGRTTQSFEIREGMRFTPSTAESENFIKYATKIKLLNPQMGICVVKLNSFKPPFVTNEESSMKTSTQYINKMFQRWSPATRELLIIKCAQKHKMKTSPLFDGLEMDLVNLRKYVQERGGLKIVMENNSWGAIMDQLKLSSRIGPRRKKLESLYLKYLLPYETMTYLEKEDIHHRVMRCWEDIHKKHLERALHPFWRQESLMQLESYNDDAPTDDIVEACIEHDDCVSHNNRHCTLKQFRKIAERAKQVYLPDKNTVVDIEREFCRIVILGTEHVSVNIASVDSSEHGHGFPADEGAPYGSHPWNLKKVCQSPDNVLSFLPFTVGISAPSLHYGMIFTTSCWHMDPHMLPWVEYLHEGPPKIWYSVPESQSANFRAAVSVLCPTAVQNKSIWLPADITMIPPNLLQQHNVTLDRIVQHPGEFVIVYPNTYSASVDTGMTISEGTYFAPHSWLQNVEHIFKELRDNCEPSMFPLEQLLIGIANYDECPAYLLAQAHNVLQPLVAAELRHRAAATSFGLTLLTPEEEAKTPRRLRPTSNECFYCRCTIHLSRVVGLTENGTAMCLEHGLRLFDKMKSRNMEETERAYCVLLFSNEDLERTIATLQERITKLATDWSS